MRRYTLVLMLEGNSLSLRSESLEQFSLAQRLDLALLQCVVSLALQVMEPFLCEGVPGGGGSDPQSGPTEARGLKF